MWHVSTHQLLTQFSSHRRAVAEVIIDNLHPHLIHSCSEDKLIVTYNLKEDRQVVQHSLHSGNFTGTFVYEFVSRHSNLAILQEFICVIHFKILVKFNLLALTQRKDQEHEQITGGSDGRILFWDCVRYFIFLRICVRYFFF